jgi:CoA-transferase family III
VCHHRVWSDAGHDLSYIAHSGLLGALTPDLPWQPALPLALQAGALAAVAGIQATLLQVARSGKGAFIDISLSEAATWLLTCGINPLSDRPFILPATPDRRLYVCADGRFIAVASAEPRTWGALCDGLGVPELKGTLHKPADAKNNLVVAPWLDPHERPKDREGWSAFGRRLSCLSRQLAQESLRFAWHNHEFEFEVLPDGSFGIDHAVGEDVLVELDLGWLFRAGQDPLIWLKRYEGRLPAVHVKDVAAPNSNLEEMNFADVGAGVMDWPRYWRAAVQAGAELMVAEHDAPSDWRRFARVSASAMRRLAGLK